MIRFFLLIFVCLMLFLNNARATETILEGAIYGFLNSKEFEEKTWLKHSAPFWNLRLTYDVGPGRESFSSDQAHEAALERWRKAGIAVQEIVDEEQAFAELVFKKVYRATASKRFYRKDIPELLAGDGPKIDQFYQEVDQILLPLVESLRFRTLRRIASEAGSKL